MTKRAPRSTRRSERDLDRSLAPIDCVPQDVTRVFLNLIGNGFYAANKRSREADAAFRPVLKIATRDLGEAVEVRVRDNGVGIAPEYRRAQFQHGRAGAAWNGQEPSVPTDLALFAPGVGG